MKTTTNYNSKKYYVGSRHKTINSGEIIICGKIEDHEYYTTQYMVRFNDGTEKRVGLNQIKLGSITNKNNISVYGVGFLGEGKYKSCGSSLNKRRHNLWTSMLWRCYSPNAHITRPTYKDCTVEPRWLNFQNFSEDIKLLEGYELWINESNNIHLDKDLKVKGNKVYGFETCKFVTSLENMSCVRNGDYEGTNIKTGQIVSFNCIASFSREFNLNRVCVNRAIKGFIKITNGWTFKEL